METSLRNGGRIKQTIITQGNSNTLYNCAESYHQQNENTNVKFIANEALRVSQMKIRRAKSPSFSSHFLCHLRLKFNLIGLLLHKHKQDAHLDDHQQESTMSNKDSFNQVIRESYHIPPYKYHIFQFLKLLTPIYSITLKQQHSLPNAIKQIPR